MNKTRDLKSLYEQGLSTTELAHLLGLPRSTIYRLLKTLKVKLRNKSDSMSLIRGKSNWLKYNLTIPDFTTDESAYWLGFLLGDGCVQKSERSGHCIRLDLQARDQEHLEKFRQWLGSTHPITYRDETNAYSIRIVSKTLVAELEEYGVVPNKSLTAKVDNRLRQNVHFWRGLVDADGHISLDRNGTIGLTGTRHICEGFISLIDDTKAKPVLKKGACYGIVFTCRMARRVIQRLYNINGTRLNRKNTIADSILSTC